MDPITEKAANLILDTRLMLIIATEHQGRGIKYNLGSNIGLVANKVDSTVQNGVHYA
ncbi:MAG: hypothetical protein H6611_05030 [Ignavibacteriales bacterium]|nr:hypothetical protein [Ignavibacteriales bacterium]